MLLNWLLPTWHWCACLPLMWCRVEEAAAKARQEVQRQREEQRKYQEVSHSVGWSVSAAALVTGAATATVLLLDL